jgi:hypothetical protein
MIKRCWPTARGTRLRGALLLAAALIAPAVFAQTVSGAALVPVHSLFAADESLPGDGRPPSPGPTDPDDPSK